ncbi:hypothetical protein MBLNU230_g6588t1 [Neophaeotheca triangularis]
MRKPGSNPPPLGADTSENVPNPQDPKARPPRGWRDHLLFPGRSLPTYTGPYSVGTMEIEVPVDNPRHFSEIKRDHKYALQLETVLMTVYYPVSREAHQADEKDPFQYSRELWLGRPRLGIAQGYGNFAGMGRLAYPIFLPTMFTKLPAYRNAPIAQHWAAKVNVRDENVSVKTREGSKPQEATKMPKFPVMLFSHGLGGTRTMYSSMCGEFASYGFVVCAVEHRDGSGPRTYVNHAPKAEQEGSADERETKGSVHHHAEDKRRGYEKKEYIYPRDNPFDTSPQNPQGPDSDLRAAQIDLRIAELEESYKVLRMINEGHGEEIVRKNLRRKGYKGSSSHGLNGVQFDQWKHRIHLTHVTAAGHSFGAATACEMMRDNNRFPYISQGICYDIWGVASKKIEERTKVSNVIDIPLLAINSEAFTYWPENFATVSNVVQEAQNAPSRSPAWLMTVRGTVHVNQSDFSLLYPKLCSFALKSMADPQRALDLNINASLEFLSHALPSEFADVLRAYTNEELLSADLAPLEAVPEIQKHMPKQKYTAARLRIPHEWMFRIFPKAAQKVRLLSNRQGHEPPGEGGEVWLHVKPTASSIEDHYKRSNRSDWKKTTEEADGELTRDREPNIKDDEPEEHPDNARPDSSDDESSTRSRKSSRSRNSTTVNRDP